MPGSSGQIQFMTAGTASWMRRLDCYITPRVCRYEPLQWLCATATGQCVELKRPRSREHFDALIVYDVDRHRLMCA